MTDEALLIAAEFSRATEPGITQSMGIALMRLHRECADLYWRRSQPLVEAIVRQPTPLPVLRIRREGLTETLEVIHPQPTAREQKLRRLLAHRQDSCFRPYLEMVGKALGVPWRSLRERPG